MAKGKARKQTKGKPLKRGLPWFAWLGIGVAIVAIVVLACSPTDQAANPHDSGEPRAAIIDQLYAFDHPNQEFIDEVTDTLEGDGFEVDLYQGDEVTVDFYRDLPKHSYKLLILRTHSGLINPTGEAVVKTSLFTSQLYNRIQYPREQLTEEVVKARVDPGYPYYFAVDSRFIARRTKGHFDNTVIIIAGCSCLAIQDLAQAFINKGASAYLAWDHTVKLDYVDDAAIALMENLCAEGLTIEEAVVKTMKEKGPDPECGAVLRYYPAQSGNKTIEELIGR